MSSMLSEQILKYFPPPKFLSMPAAGLAISDRAVRFLKFKKRSFGLAPVVFGSEEIPANVVKNGEVADPKALSDIIAKIHPRLGTDFVAVSVPEERAYIFKAEVPDVGEDLVRENLKMRLEEFVPTPIDESVFDFTLKENLGNGSRAVSVEAGVAVLPKKVVSSFISVIESAGLVPVALQIDAFSSGRALIKKGEQKIYLIVNIGREAVTFSIVGGGIVYFTTTVTGIGGAALTSAVERSFGVGTKRAEEIKEDGVFTDKRDNSDFFVSVANTLSVLRDEMNKIFAYWKEHGKTGASSRSASIDAVLLCGRDAAVNGLREYLSSSIKTPVHIGNVWANAFSFEDYVPSIDLRDSLDFAAAVGLAALRPE